MNTNVQRRGKKEKVEAAPSSAGRERRKKGSTGKRTVLIVTLAVNFLIIVAVGAYFLLLFNEQSSRQQTVSPTKNHQRETFHKEHENENTQNTQSDKDVDAADRESRETNKKLFAPVEEDVGEDLSRDENRDTKQRQDEEDVEKKEDNVVDEPAHEQQQSVVEDTKQVEQPPKDEDLAVDDVPAKEDTVVEQKQLPNEQSEKSSSEEKQQEQESKKTTSAPEPSTQSPASTDQPTKPSPSEQPQETKKASEVPKPTNPPQAATPPPAEIPDQKRLQPLLDSDVNCEQLMDKARQAMMQGESYYNPAVDMLTACTMKEPGHSRAHWNKAVLLVKMDQKEEAAPEMEVAISIEPKNAVYRQGLATLYYNMQNCPLAAKALEAYLEVQLGVKDFPELMETIYYQREDELSFLVEEDKEQILSTMTKLLKCYLDSRQLTKADRLYQILITVQPHEHDLMSNYATFALGLGNIWNGVKFMKVKMEHDFVHSNLGNVEEAYQVMTAHMLRLATSGFDSHIVNLARSLLVSGTSAVKMIRENCYEDMLHSVTPATVELSQQELTKNLGTCLDQQRIVGSLIQAGASPVANNRFGWTSFLHGALLGQNNVVKSMIENKMEVEHRNMLGQTALHVAAIRGHHHLVPTLLKAGLKKDDVDEYGRTPVDVVCSVGLFASEFIAALKAKQPTDCPSPLVTRGSSPPRSSSGDWLDNYKPLPEGLDSDSCDIDSVSSDITAAAFLRDYLSLQKPVIIRHGMSYWAKLKTVFQRRSLDQDYGVLMFPRSAVPNGDAFGLPQNVTSLHDYLVFLTDLSNKEKKGIAPPLVDIVSKSLEEGHLLRQHFQVPAVLDPKVTAMSTKTVQFYVGPSHTGTPPRFNNFVWNGLVYGSRRWFISPPHKAIYSKQHVMEWYKQHSPVAGLRCTQHPGDVIFIPAMWGHAAINLRESIGFESEFIYGAAEFSV